MPNRKPKPEGTAAAPSRRDIVDCLEREIVFGLLHPRQRLVEDDLMERFGATRHTVRRSIEDLVRIGLAVHEPNKGAYVRDFTTREAEELYEIRDLLQRHAIERMKLPLRQDLVERLARLHEAHVAAGMAGDVQALFRLNNDFHDAFFEACGNASLADAIRSYAWRTHPIRSRGFLNESYLRQAQDDHAEIVAAAARGDRERLIEVNARHLLRPKELYLRAQKMLGDGRLIAS